MFIYTLIKGIRLILVLLNVPFLVTLIPKRAINDFILPTSKYYVSMDVQFYERESYVSRMCL